MFGWVARHPDKHGHSLQDIPVSAPCLKGLLKFRMGRHRLPRDETCGLGRKLQSWN